jgi:predicted acyltransferase
MQASGVVDYASPSTPSKSQRLVSLDVFRGLVILAMLIVNNIGDNATTGYFWKHAGWVPMGWEQAWKMWFARAFKAEPPAQQIATLDAQIADLYAQCQRMPDAVNQIDLNYNFARIDAPTPPSPQAWQEEIRRKINEWSDTAMRYDTAVAERRITLAPWRHIPLFSHCTLADYVMPWFMLIIGVAIPFSVASAISRGISKQTMWLRTLRRAAMLVLLGWILCYFRDQFADSLYGKAPWSFTLGMDVLQLLGMAYLFARILYELPIKPRALLAGLLLVVHWALLKFYPQGDVPPGTFNQHFDAIGYIYDHWNTQNIGPIVVSFRGLLSVPPAAATMLTGTLIGDQLRREDFDPRKKVRGLVAWGMLMVLTGFLLAFDLPFNKPRWTPSYLLYTSGVGTVLLAVLYYLIDVKQRRRWTYPLVVFGTNAIALYFLSILAKVLLLNTPRVHGRPMIEVILSTLKNALGPWLGGWTFTILFIAIWWVILDQMYRRKVFWKL